MLGTLVDRCVRLWFMRCGYCATFQNNGTSYRHLCVVHVRVHVIFYQYEHKLEPTLQRKARFEDRCLPGGEEWVPASAVASLLHVDDRILAPRGRRGEYKHCRQVRARASVTIR